MFNFRRGDPSPGFRLRSDGIDELRNAGLALCRTAARALKECAKALGHVGTIARA